MRFHRLVHQDSDSQKRWTSLPRYGGYWNLLEGQIKYRMGARRHAGGESLIVEERPIHGRLDPSRMA